MENILWPKIHQIFSPRYGPSHKGVSLAIVFWMVMKPSHQRAVNKSDRWQFLCTWRCLQKSKTICEENTVMTCSKVLMMPTGKGKLYRKKLGYWLDCYCPSDCIVQGQEGYCRSFGFKPEVHCQQFFDIQPSLNLTLNLPSNWYVLFLQEKNWSSASIIQKYMMGIKVQCYALPIKCPSNTAT